MKYMRILFCFLLILFIIFLIYLYICKRPNINNIKEDYQNGRTKDTKNTIRILNKSKKIHPQDNIISNYIIATLIQNDDNNNEDETPYFQRALEAIIKYEYNNNDTFLNEERIFDVLEDNLYIPMETRDQFLNKLRTKPKQSKLNNLKNRKIKTDPENVHDRLLNNTNKKRYEFICNYIDRTPSFSYVIEKLLQHPKTNEKVRAVLKKIKPKHKISVLNDEPLHLILCKVYRYCEMRGNNLIDALIQGLENSYEGKVVCAHGICSRILDSFVLIDKSFLGNPAKNIEIIRKEMCSKTYKILQDNIRSEENNKKYMEDDPAFLAMLEDKIKTILQSDYKNTDIDKETLDKLIEEMIAGI